MTDDKLFVIGATVSDIHAWTTARNLPWNRIEPVTGADQLRTRPGQKPITVVSTPSFTRLPAAVQSVIRTQLSIRRCLDSVMEIGADLDLLAPFASPAGMDRKPRTLRPVVTVRTI